jgi:sigma54-dependent transcription regulator
MRMERAKLSSPEFPDPSRDILERERSILLELGNDITRVREKNDLLLLFSKRIKGLFYFTHTIISLIDNKDDTYSAFLLDKEIGEMPLETQSKLLRVIQERELERLGGKQTIKVDIRLITATNRNLEDEVKAGRFRSDLYFRLNVFPISLPPLRDRREDIEPLAYYFVGKYNKNTGRKIRKIAPKVIQQLSSYTWPGNIRELENLVHSKMKKLGITKADYFSN